MPRSTSAATRIEDWVTFAIFWLMTLAVFLQFFTRYVLNDCFAWTEEIATYCLVAIVFLGSAMCVRLGRHIHVDSLFRYLPAGVARALDRGRRSSARLFFAYAAWLVWRFMRSDRGRDDDDDRPAQEPVYGAVFARLRPDVRALHPGVGRELAARLLDPGAPEALRRRTGFEAHAMLILLGSFLLLMILGLPVALAMAVSSLLYILSTASRPT